VVFLYLGELIEHGPAQDTLVDPEQEMTKEYIHGIIS
jgi:phosphate transport system ATP-binding protein